MVARQDHFEKSQQKEKDFLKSMEDTLSREERAEIVALNKSLEDEQNLRDSEKEQKLLNELPTLSTADIRRDRQTTESTTDRIQGVPMEWLDVPTNGMTYLRLRFSLENMSDMHRQYIRLLTDILPRVGGRDHNYQ